MDTPFDQLLGEIATVGFGFLIAVALGMARVGGMLVIMPREALGALIAALASD